MNIHIITSSYPATPEDPSGTAGLFVRQFVLELVQLGHTVVVQPAARKSHYHSDPGILVVPTPWKGGDRELASMNFLHPGNWLIFLRYFVAGIRNTRRINQTHAIDRVLCMWAVPSGLFGLAGKMTTGTPYDVWALGSDIWKIRKIPWLGNLLLRVIMRSASKVYADGLQLCRDVTEITSVGCKFLATSRKLPEPQEMIVFPDGGVAKHFLFVGRYHPNKGPDLLLEALSLMPEALRRTVRVHMFGLGPMEEGLKGMIAARQLEETVRLHGPIQAQELADYLESVAFLVIPSRIESVPVIFSDALQLGTPVVAMPVGDLAHLITESGCGIVAEEVTAEALARAMEKAVVAGRPAFEQGTTKAYAQFEIGKSVAGWLDAG